MSYVLRAFAVSISAVRETLGGQNAALASAVAERRDVVGGADSGTGMTMREAVHDLITGAPRRAHCESVYGYALLQICALLGRELPAKLWIGVRLDALEHSGVEAIVFRTTSPFDVPYDGDFPLIGALESRKVHNVLQSMDAAGTEPTHPQLRELLQEFVGWLRTAEKERSDLVFFVH